jgi:hypothetical protein
VLGHQVGDELVAVDRVEVVGSWKVIPKNRPATPSQNGEPPRSSMIPRSSARMRSAKRGGAWR